MSTEDHWNLIKSRVGIGSRSILNNRYSFAIYTAETDSPFIFQYDQGSNHWESGVSVVGLEEISENRRQYYDHLIESGCTWAVNIFEQLLPSRDRALIVSRIIEWHKSIQDIQYE